MPDKLFGLIPFTSIPFFLTVDGKGKFNKMRLIESLVQAIIIGSLIVIFMITKLDSIELKIQGNTNLNKEVISNVRVLCDEMNKLKLDVMRIDTLQRERIEKERAGGLRR